MTEEESLLQAVLDNPYDDAPRLAYAEWCDRRNAPDPPPDPRGEFIRLQLKLAGEKDESFSRLTDSLREKELLDAFGLLWSAPVAALVQQSTFHRGFIAHVKLAARDFLVRAELLFRLAPLALVSLTGVRPVVRELAALPPLSRLGALDLSSNELTTAEVRLLARSPYVYNLWWLDLGWNRIDFEGAQVLAGASNLANLRHLSLTGNPCDPHETAGVEGYTIVDVRLPPEGKSLEAQFGPIPWLHYPTGSLSDYPPSPFLRPPNA